ncbi:hypothetical protein WH06_01885, partial [Aeromonas salmonicida subsp. salmonicida]
AMRGQHTAPVTLDHDPVAELTPELDQATTDHASAYADHCAAIEGASSVEEWQKAYATAWAWAGETGDPAIADGIKQVAGERKAQLNKAK